MVSLARIIELAKQGNFEQKVSFPISDLCYVEKAVKMMSQTLEGFNYLIVDDGRGEGFLQTYKGVGQNA